MKTVLETIQAGAEFLDKRGIENGRLNMQHLVAHVLDCDRMQLYIDFDRPLNEDELAPLRELFKRRSLGEPLQHLVGKVPFSGHDFLCDSRALIPRPETEELVAKLIEMYPDDVPGRILDMGTGSGVIGLSLAAAWKDNVKSVVLSDIAPDALALAKENATQIGLEDFEPVEYVESDLFDALAGREFDLIVANLPYIAAGEVPTLSREVRHDPVSALDGGPIGTELMARFIATAKSHVTEGGRIAMEFGMGQAPALTGFLQGHGWEDIDVLKEFGGIERMLFANR
jgi:release factor glutamine methyltransferase